MPHIRTFPARTDKISVEFVVRPIVSVRFSGHTEVGKGKAPAGFSSDRGLLVHPPGLEPGTH